MKFVPLLVVLCMIHSTSEAQSCCGPQTPTASFASLTTSKSFRAAHAVPHPFHLAEPKGTMVSFHCKDGADGHAYMLNAASKSDKYVFMIHEWWGLNDYIKKEAESLQAELGSDVNICALDLYDGKVATTREAAGKYMQEANETRIRAIISGAIEMVGPKAHVATVGWCFGGGWSMQTTLMLGKQAAGCVMYYGMPETDDKKLSDLNVPVLFIHAKKDKWINDDVVKAFEERMKRLSKTLSVKSYDADHAFANPSNPIFDKDAASDAHAKCVAFLKERL